MKARITRMNRALEACRADLRLTSWYGHTGNLVAETNSLSRADAGRIVSELDHRNWIAFGAEALLQIVQQVASIAAPENQRNVRWTPGLIFAVTRPDPAYRIQDSPRGRFNRTSLTIVAAWKRDRSESAVRLHKDRNGGWGALSCDLGEQTKSVWTARSLRTVRGVLRWAGLPPAVVGTVAPNPRVERTRIKQKNLSGRRSAGRSRAGR